MSVIQIKHDENEKLVLNTKKTYLHSLNTCWKCESDWNKIEMLKNNSCLCYCSSCGLKQEVNWSN